MHTLEQMHAQIGIWEQSHKPESLAEDAFNRDLIGNYLARQHGGEITVANLNEAVRVLRPSLHFIGAAPPVKHRNDSWNFLASFGVMKDPHLSHAEKQEAEKSKAVTYNKILNDITATRERRDLKQRLADAQGIIVQSPGGRTNHRATADARAAAVNRLRYEIVAFNRKHPDQVIVIEEKP